MKTVTFGELLLRLAPQGNLRFFQEPSFEATFGGGEANVAVSLANFGQEAEFVTALPDNDIGQSAINELRKFGVGTKNILRQGKRIGIYYCEKGAAQRPGKVVYDRAFSSVSESRAEDYDFERIFENADWFHFSGITPALSQNCYDVCLKMAQYCRKKNITVSFDLNYRSKLLSLSQMKELVLPLLEYTDVLIANENQAEQVFELRCTEKDEYARNRETAEKLFSAYPCRLVALTERRTFTADRNGIFSSLYDGKEQVFSRRYDMDMVDRVGGGDAFTAGLIYALKSGKNLQESAEFATAASCLKHSIQGDFNRVSVEEAEALVRGGTGRVER